MPAKAKTKIMSGGVGPSKRFNAPDAPSAHEKLKGCHLGGIPIEEIDEEVVRRIHFQNTDEGIIERNRGKSPAVARVTSGPFDKKVEQRGDFRRNEREPWEAPDVMKELTERHIPPGFSGKFLNQRVCEKKGMRGFEVVKVNGDPVKLGNMVLGQMPIERKEQRNRAYREAGQRQLERVTTKFNEAHERIQSATSVQDDD